LQITLIGWLLIPVGIVLMAVAPRRLYLAMLFLAPFSATAVMNIGAGSNASGLQVFVFFSFLLVLRAVLDALIRLKISIPATISRPLAYLSVFVFICFISIVMPLLIDGRLQVMSPYLLDMTTTPLQFSSSNITGCIYLLLGACSGAIIARRTLDPNEFRLAVKVYTLSGFFISLWGLMQMGCRLVGVPYPSFVFNSSATGSAQGFDSIMDATGFQRISSVAVEPSIFAASLLTIIPFSLIAFFGDGHVVSRRADKWIFGVMLAALLASTSSTAYVGVLVLLGLSLRYLVKFKGLRLRYIALIFCVLGSIVLAYLAIPPIRLLIQAALFSKAGGYSALERSKTVVYAFGYFLRYPILGVGWSSVTSHDSIVKLLSNCGILGLLAFTVFVGSILVALRRRIKALDIRNKAKAFDSPLLIMLVIVFTTLAIAAMDGFPYVFGHFWVVLGLAMSAPALSRQHAYLFLETKN
jgi:hypothetical protein